MQAVLDEDSISVEWYDSRPCPKNGGKRIIAHADAASGDGWVGDKGGLVGDHVICCASICNAETCARPRRVGPESDHGVRRRVVEKGNDKLWKLHCADTRWVDGGCGAVATGGDRWEVWARDVDGGMRHAWVDRNDGFRITTAVNLSLIFTLVIEVIARFVAVGFRGRRKCSRHPCRPSIFGRRIRGGGWSSWWGWSDGTGDGGIQG